MEFPYDSDGWIQLSVNKYYFFSPQIPIAFHWITRCSAILLLRLTFLGEGETACFGDKNFSFYLFKIEMDLFKHSREQLSWFRDLVSTPYERKPTFVRFHLSRSMVRHVIAYFNPNERCHICTVRTEFIIHANEFHITKTLQCLHLPIDM